MAKAKMNYGQAVQEIESILAKIENNQLDVDELGGEVKRATQLINLCKQKLHKANTEVQQALEQMELELKPEE